MVPAQTNQIGRRHTQQQAQQNVYVQHTAAAMVQQQVKPYRHHHRRRYVFRHIQSQLNHRRMRVVIGIDPKKQTVIQRVQKVHNF